MNWQSLSDQEQLTERQLQQFQQYADALVAWNEKMNLTAITAFDKIIGDHFSDSLAVTHCLPFSNTTHVCDVGTGAGFPGIPIKIKFPEIPLVLIEVNLKKISFLEHIIQLLDLKNVVISSKDWLTFLRKHEYPITHFLARASLRPDVLVHALKPTSAYRKATIIYWASEQWRMGEQESPFFSHEYDYQIDDKKRRLVFFCN